MGFIRLGQAARLRGVMDEHDCVNIFVSEGACLESIIAEMSRGMKEKVPEIILDRRNAIARALALAQETPNSAVILTGKGTDPFIMGPKGSRIPWDEAGVAREELAKLGYTTTK